MHAVNPNLPFGGVGFSGNGRYHGKSGFEGCSNMKSYTEVAILDVYPLTSRFPPYTPEKQVPSLSDLETAAVLLEENEQAHNEVSQEVLLAGSYLVGPLEGILEIPLQHLIVRTLTLNPLINIIGPR